MIWCRENGKMYIGSATCPVERRSAHICHLKNGKHHSVRLQRAYNKYGADSIEFAVLENTTEDNLLGLEQEYLDLFQPTIPRYGFNILSVAGRSTGRVCSKETREKISKTKRGVARDPENVALQKATLARQRPERIRLSIEKRGISFTIVSPSGETIQTKGVKSFARLHGLCRVHLAEVIRGKALSVKGWRLPGVVPPSDHVLLSPSSQIETVPKGKLKAFSQERGLSYGRLQSLTWGEITNYKGWTLSKQS